MKRIVMVIILGVVFIIFGIAYAGNKQSNINTTKSKSIWKNLSFGMDVETVENKLEEIGLEYNEEYTRKMEYDYIGKLVIKCIELDIKSTIKTDSNYIQKPTLGFYNDRLVYISYDVNEGLNYDDKNYLSSDNTIKLLIQKYGGKVSYYYSGGYIHPELYHETNSYIISSTGNTVILVEPSLRQKDITCTKNILKQNKDRL